MTLLWQSKQLLSLFNQGENCILITLLLLSINEGSFVCTQYHGIIENGLNDL